MKKVWVSLVVFVLIIAGVLVFRHQNVRAPSSVKIDSRGAIELIDNDLSKNENKKLIKRAVLQSLDWAFSAEKARLTFKFENLKLSNGNEIIELCAAYPNIAITLEAPNISYSGEHPEILAIDSCEATGSIVTFNIDLSLLIDPSVLKNVNAQSSLIDSALRIGNWYDETPDKWRVKNLIFYSDSKIQSQNFEIIKYEILSVLGYSIEFQSATKKQ